MGDAMGDAQRSAFDVLRGGRSVGSGDVHARCAAVATGATKRRRVLPPGQVHLDGMRWLTRHNLASDLRANIDLVPLIVHAALFVADDRIDVRAFCVLSSVDTAFRSAALAETAQLLRRLRALLQAVREAFRASLLARPVPTSYRWKEEVTTAGRAQRFRSPERSAYADLVGRVVADVDVAACLATNFFTTAMWESTEELIAWAGSFCLACRKRHRDLSTGARTSLAPRTACHDAFSCSPIVTFGSNLKRSLRKTFGDLPEIEKCTNCWLQRVPGIPVEATFAHKYSVPQADVDAFLAALAVKRSAAAVKRQETKARVWEDGRVRLENSAKTYLKEFAPELSIASVRAYEDRLLLPHSIPRSGRKYFAYFDCLDLFKQRVDRMVARDPSLTGVNASAAFAKAANAVNEAASLRPGLTLQQVLKLERRLALAPAFPWDEEQASNVRISRRKLQSIVSAFCLSLSRVLAYLDEPSAFHWEWDKFGNGWSLVANE